MAKTYQVHDLFKKKKIHIRLSEFIQLKKHIRFSDRSFGYSNFSEEDVMTPLVFHLNNQLGTSPKRYNHRAIKLTNELS